MLDIKFIVGNIDIVKANCQRRNVDPTIVDMVVNSYVALKKHNSERDSIVHLQRELGRQIANAKDDMVLRGRAETYASVKRQAEENIANENAVLDENLKKIPNLTHPLSPDTNYKTLRRNNAAWVERAIDHVEIGEKLDILNFNKASHITGSKFYYLKNEAVILESALVRFAFDVLRKNRFSIFKTPDLALTSVVEDMGFVPRSESGQIYQVKDTELCLIGTSEITLGAMHRDEFIDKKDLPLRYGGISHCFRKEAGAPGKENKGLYRVHQFTKVEMFVFCHPSNSEQILEELVAIEEFIYKSLGLQYRVIDIPANDLGNPAHRKIDLEVWMPGRREWGEVTSASNCTDYQSRRLRTKYQGEAGTDRGLVHTLNGTAIAVPRTILAILENFQQDGKIIIPECLRKYTGFEQIPQSLGW